MHVFATLTTQLDVKGPVMTQSSAPGGWPDPSTGSSGTPPSDFNVRPPSPQGSGGGWADPAAPTPPTTAAAPQPLVPPTAYGAPAAAPPGFHYGYGHPYAYPPPPKTNGMSIAALVISILGILGTTCYGLGGFIGALGAIFGHIARRQIRARGESGDGMALAGIIVGWIGVALTVFIALLIVGWFALLSRMVYSMSTP